MNQNTKEKKIDLVVIVISAIVVSFIISFFASYAYESLHNKKYINWVYVVLILLLILAVALLYSLLLSNVGKNKITISTPITFSQKEHRFIDLPFNYLSVQTRVYFSRLPVQGQVHLATYDNWKNFFNSELNRFLNQSIQASIISRILSKWKFDNRGEKTFIDKQKFPTPIRENYLLEDWFKEEGKLYAPFIENIISFGPNNSFLEISSKYGTIKFTWNILYVQTSYHSKYFIDKAISEKEVHDFEIVLTMAYQGSISRIFSKGINKFYEWCDSLEKLLRDYDWNSRNVDRVLVVLKQMKDDLQR